MSSETVYLGYTLEQITRSGRDLLAQKVLRRGEPSPAQVRAALPPVEEGRYCFLGGPACWHGLILYPDGSAAPQQRQWLQGPTPLFSPLEEDCVLGGIAPEQRLLDNWLPIVTSTHRKGADRLEVTCFVEYGDPDEDPQLWLRAHKKIAGRAQTRYYVLSRSRPVPKRAITEEEFDAARRLTEAEWRRLAEGFDVFSLPEAALETGLKAMMCGLFSTFSGDQAHYGHLFYGRDIHDNFPPSYLCAMETCHALGMFEQAWRFLEHLLRFGIGLDGQFYYRQGLRDQNGASGADYGRLLWWMERAERCQPRIYRLRAYCRVIGKIAEHLAAQIAPDPAAGGQRLVRMCAEADTRSRIHAYANNNLWAVRGFYAAGALLNRLGEKTGERYVQRARELYRSVRCALDGAAVQSAVGKLVPFQFGYSALPLTLSNCRDASREVSEEEYANYLKQKDFDSRIEAEQDYSENTYANYRYYLEMLSSGLLEREEEEAIVRLRESFGGELLGMTRLYERLDDWTADHYARYLLENDRLDKYLLLYYAHYYHHGNPEMGVYYEQVSADGRVAAPDCVPSMLLLPLMTAWMFCFEPVRERAVYLLRGVRRDGMPRESAFRPGGLPQAAAQ